MTKGVTSKNGLKLVTVRLDLDTIDRIESIKGNLTPLLELKFSQALRVIIERGLNELEKRP